MAYSPLGRGFLSGAIKSIDDLAEDDWRRKTPRFSEENFQKNLDAVEAVKKMAERMKVSPSHIALAYVASKGPHIIPLTGTTKKEHLEESMGYEKVKLSENDVKSLEEAFKNIAGDRYSDMSSVSL